MSCLRVSACSLGLLLVSTAGWAQSPPPPPAPPVATKAPWGGPAAPAAVVPGVTAPTVAAAPDDAALALRLNRVVGQYAAVEEGRRSTLRWVGLGVGGVALGVGGAAMGTSEPGEARYTSGIFALSMGVGVGLGVLLGSVIETPSDELVRAHRAARQGGLEGGQWVAATERSWEEIVARQRRQRRVAGYLLMGLGALLGLGGAALVFAEPGDSASARDATAVSGALSFGLGSALVVGGGAVLHAPDTLEAGWDVWRAARGAAP